ncbi:MAG TPA: type II toxin-antitoxin system HicB family antitoxin [bacterium]|nr:type II toxin-antitoxin system HicB family antitoxin [bacterium]HPP30157.1 type II toxin-antitoxin system HicB family antitoxin [bacterium]
MKEISFVIWKEGKYYVAQCLNVDVASFGITIDEAKKNLKEAVELYFEEEQNTGMEEVGDVIIGREIINA